MVFYFFVEQTITQNCKYHRWSCIFAANDVVEIIVYDVFSVANTVSQTGGTFSGSVTFSSTNYDIQGSNSYRNNKCNSNRYRG